ncbi:hypothetical protein ACFFRR_007786 [Megaselia abdita]
MSTQELKYSIETKKFSSTSSSSIFRRFSLTRSENFGRNNYERATIAGSRLAPGRQPQRKTSLLNDAMLFQPPSDKPSTKKKSALKNGSVYVFKNSQVDKNNKVVNSYEMDIGLLEDAFAKFNMKIILKKEKTKSRIQNRIKEIAKENFDKCSCIVVVILSEGKRHDKIAAKDNYYSIDDDIVLPLLKNKTLQGKPKIFIVQASKGDFEIGNVQTDASSSGGNPSEVIKLYSSFEGFLSYRNENGSFLIQEFTKLLKESGDYLGIADIFEHVVREVKNNTRGKQIPVIIKNLDQKFVFGDYK